MDNRGKQPNSLSRAVAGMYAKITGKSAASQAAEHPQPAAEMSVSANRQALEDRHTWETAGPKSPTRVAQAPEDAKLDTPSAPGPSQPVRPLRTKMSQTFNAVMNRLGGTERAQQKRFEEWANTVRTGEAKIPNVIAPDGTMRVDTAAVEHQEHLERLQNTVIAIEKPHDTTEVNTAIAAFNAARTKLGDFQLPKAQSLSDWDRNPHAGGGDYLELQGGHAAFHVGQGHYQRVEAHQRSLVQFKSGVGLALTKNAEFAQASGEQAQMKRRGRSGIGR